MLFLVITQVDFARLRCVFVALMAVSSREERVLSCRNRVLRFEMTRSLPVMMGRSLVVARGIEMTPSSLMLTRHRQRLLS